MKYTPTLRLNTITLARFFEDVWDAEVFSDIETLQNLFQKIWTNPEDDPDFAEYEDHERAQLFRSYGYFLSHYGRAKNLPNYQERGKNLLTKAIDLFNRIGLSEKAIEAKVVLGLCYFHEGAIEESVAIFDYISSLFEENQLHPLYLRSQLNSTLILQWKGEYQKALKIIEEIEIPMEFCKDTRLLTIYYTQAGLIYRGINQYDLAVNNYNKCIEVAQQENNWLVVAKNHNNLAFLYKTLKRFKLAYFHTEQSINIAKEFKLFGWLPHFLDTKSIIEFKEGNLNSALETINEAIAIFQNGEDYIGLIDAYWNKTKCLLKLSYKQEAIELFAELCQIARLRIGDYAVKRYSKLFSEIIYVNQNCKLDEEVRRFKESEIRKAFYRCKHNIQQTSELLGFSNISYFTKVIGKEFPSLFAELGIADLLNKPEIKEIQKERTPKKEESPKQINKIDLQNTNISFINQKEAFLQSEFSNFYVSNEITSSLFEINEDIVVATIPVKKAEIDSYVLAKRFDTDEYIFSRILHDKNLDISYLVYDDEPFPLEEVSIIGQAIGYCLFTDIDRETIEFKPLPNI